MKYTKIREIMQKEYDRNPVDSSYNFISRFATAVFNEQEILKNKNNPIKKNNCEHKRVKYSYGTGGSECLDCGAI